MVVSVTCDLLDLFVTIPQFPSRNNVSRLLRFVTFFWQWWSGVCFVPTAQRRSRNRRSCTLSEGDSKREELILKTAWQPARALNNKEQHQLATATASSGPRIPTVKWELSDGNVVLRTRCKSEVEGNQNTVGWSTGLGGDETWHHSWRTVFARKSDRKSL